MVSLHSATSRVTSGLFAWLRRFIDNKTRQFENDFNKFAEPVCGFN